MERSRERNRRRRERKRRRKCITVLIIFLFLIGALAISYQFAKKAVTPQTGQRTGEEIEVTIPNGAGTYEIAKILKEKKLITNAGAFRIESRLQGFDGTYREGTYAIDTGMTSSQIMELLQSGGTQNDKLRLTVPEGFTTAEIAARLEKQGIVTAAEFIKEANEGTFSYSFLQGLPQRENRLEGYLFPDTYFLSEGITAHEIIDKMLTQFEKVYTEVAAGGTQVGFTMDQLVTVASVIEAEIQVPEEQPRAAGVIYNRLKADMPLQMDATVLYAMNVTKEDVLEKDLSYESPYNTYLHKGLPVGPIGNPGKGALSAAVSPESHSYLYYVLEAKGKSNHIYTESYEAFLEAKEAYKASK